MTRRNLRDWLGNYVPSWLADNYPESPSYGWRFLWTIALLVDVQLDMLIEATLTAVGRGSTTALDTIGQARGLMRWQDETDAAYALRLRTWVAEAKQAGSMLAIAKQLYGYLRSKPDQIVIINRAGLALRLQGGNAVSYDTTTWDWDSVSHPERAGYWSELWILVYTTTQWPITGSIETPLGGGFSLGSSLGIGHAVTREESDAIRALVAQWKAAHTYVRAIVWCDDFGMVINEGAMTNGAWGAWSDGNGAPSDRDLTHCRYWEFPS